MLANSSRQRLWPQESTPVTGLYLLLLCTSFDNPVGRQAASGTCVGVVCISIRVGICVCMYVDVIFDLCPP